MKIWITGIAGFLGSHLRDALIDEGHIVYGNDNLICGDIGNVQNHVDSQSGANMALSDCRDFQRMKDILAIWKPDVVVHCAATAHEGYSSFSPSFITQNIYEASVATFSAAIESGVKRIVYMSSMSRYGIGNPPFSEGDIPKPVDPYGIAKVAAEDTLRVLANTHGVKYSILVPHNIIGTRQRSCDPYRNVAAIIINRCKQGKSPIVYGDGSQTRCFSPVADVLPSIIRSIYGDADGEVVNIGPDEGEITVLDLANKIIDLTNSSSGINFVPGRPNEVKHATCSSAKARKLLGYQPKQHIDDCLREMVDYIKPSDFIYDFPLEINSDLCPKTWKDKLI